MNDCNKVGQKRGFYDQLRQEFGMLCYICGCGGWLRWDLLTEKLTSRYYAHLKILLQTVHYISEFMILLIQVVYS